MVEEIDMRKTQTHATLSQMIASKGFERAIGQAQYLESVEEEMDQMLTNAKIAKSETGLIIDKNLIERMEKMMQAEEIVEDDEEDCAMEDTEVDRLMAGGFQFCNQVQHCGHKCKGVRGESRCLPCLESGCREEAKCSSLPEKEDLCTICFTCEL